MSLFLFYDTETTGMPDFGQPSEAPHQPHIVQLGAMLVDPASRDIVASLDLTVKPDGWIIPDEAAAVHGITTEHALRVGVDENLAVAAFIGMWRQAVKRVGHNESFDARILRIALKRLGFEDGPALADVWKAAEAECTMKLTTPICRIPSTRGSGFKWPKLTEAYEHLFGRPMEGAHKALTDARGCMEVYWELQDREQVRA